MDALRCGLIWLGLIVMVACSEAKSPPALENVYTSTFAEYWAEMAAFAGIDPEQGLLHDWKITYDENREVQNGRFRGSRHPISHAERLRFLERLQVRHS